MPRLTMYRLRPLSAALVAALSLTAATAPAMAQPGVWGPSSWDRSYSRTSTKRLLHDRGRSQEGKVNVATFVADSDAVAALGHGPITVTSILNDDDNSLEGAVYEAAVVNELIGAGYDTGNPHDARGQVAELRITRSMIEPAETKRNPVSGQTTIGVSNRGSMVGMALNVDLSKPKGALISTKLETRIRDAQSGEILWEGRADMATRDGDEDWNAQDIAARLADRLFDRFPG